MKLLVQSDDYGISRAVACGIIHGIGKGILRNTGMFMNMPWTEECAEWIKPYRSKIALGLDLNLTTGVPLCSPADITSLVDSQGCFYSSWQSRKLDKAGNGEHVRMDDVRIELEAQIQKYIKLFDGIPDYLHSHAYETPVIRQVHRELAERYHIPYCSDVMKKLTGFGIEEYRMNWYIKPATLENQAASSLKALILKNSDALLSREYCFLIGHMGYVDQDLMSLSSYTLYRMMDLEAVVSQEILDWVQSQPVELITYKDLPAQAF